MCLRGITESDCPVRFAANIAKLADLLGRPRYGAMPSSIFGRGWLSQKKILDDEFAFAAREWVHRKRGRLFHDQPILGRLRL